MSLPPLRTVFEEISTLLKYFNAFLRQLVSPKLSYFSNFLENVKLAAQVTKPLRERALMLKSPLDCLKYPFGRPQSKYSPIF